MLGRHPELVDHARLRTPLFASLKSAMALFQGQHPTFDGEMKLTVLITWADDGAEHEILTHVAALPERPPHPVKLQIMGAPRTNAAAKDSEWIRQRKPLEAMKRDDVNEGILEGEGGELMEGLSSNFFAIKDGTVYTAGEGVLLGTVREVVIEACKREGIPVVLQPPNAADVADWDGAFVSSTSRLVLPVDEIEYEVDGKPMKKEFPGDSLSHKIEDLVLNAVRANSQELA